MILESARATGGSHFHNPSLSYIKGCHSINKQSSIGYFLDKEGLQPQARSTKHAKLSSDHNTTLANKNQIYPTTL